MLTRTSFPFAQWKIIGAYYKWHARSEAITTVADALEKALKEDGR